MRHTNVLAPACIYVPAAKPAVLLVDLAAQCSCTLLNTLHQFAVKNALGSENFEGNS